VLGSAIRLLHSRRLDLLNLLWRDYHRWISEHETPDQAGFAAIAQQISMFANPPLISVVMPVYNPPAAFLEGAIASVRNQLWPHWELCIADDASSALHVGEILAAAAAADRRIKLVRRGVNGHIAAATNSALTLADGDWVALMDHDDVIAPSALFRVAEEISRHPAAQMIYSDEDRIDARGVRHQPFFKPDFDPDLLLGQNFVNHLAVYRRALVDRLGGLRPRFDGSQDHDLALRAAAAAGPDGIRHISAVLYHWRRAASGSAFSQAQTARCADASRRAVRDHLQAQAAPAAVVGAETEPTYHRIIWALPEPTPKVAVIVDGVADPSGPEMTELLATTDYPDFEVLVAGNAGSSADPRLQVIAGEGIGFVDRAAGMTKADMLVVLRAGAVPADASWLRELASQAMRHGIGAVGGKLVDADGAVLNGPALACPPGYPERAAERHGAGTFGILALARSVPEIAGGCLAVRRDIFIAAGGFGNGNTNSRASEADFSRRLAAKGLRNLWTPWAALRVIPAGRRLSRTPIA
jgi:GT2 family glycosyltransferase